MSALRRSASPTSLASPQKRGLRGEAAVLLPISLLLFAALACVTLFAYRVAISRLVDERRAGWSREASRLAEQAATLGAGERDQLARAIPAGLAVAIFDARGSSVWSWGATGENAVRLAPPPAAYRSTAVEGPLDGSAPGGAIVAWAPFVPRARSEGAQGTAAGASGESEGRYLLRLESPEPLLAAELRSRRILTPVVVGLSIAVAALAVMFLYALNRPYAALLERARELPAAPGAPGAGAAVADETDFLLAAFDRALAALRASDADLSGGARRDAESRLAESVAQLGELAGGVAHELRNSLGTLKGYLGLAARRDLPPAAREEIAEALREADALGRVVDDFLAFARPGARDLVPLDLAPVVERALADPSLAGCTFALDRPRQPVTVRGDERLLARALRNLLRNAAQAQSAGSEPGSAVEVQIESRGSSALVAIRDRGPGIAPEMVDRLFTPFASDRPDGAGLGLALARRIVLLHGGSLRLENRPGGGAVAELELPLGSSVT